MDRKMEPMQLASLVHDIKSLPVAVDHQAATGALSSNNWIPLGLTGILLLGSWLANCILLGGALQTAGSGRIVPVAYFFVGSQAVASLLHLTINLPPAVVSILFGSSHIQSYEHIICLYSTYLDTLFCNLTFLQTFFSSLDGYLRLRNPTFYLASAKRRPALWLKVGSPWLVAAIQAIGQLALSDRHQVRLHVTSSHLNHFAAFTNLRTACLLPDPNFLIIRTAIAYALPLMTCIVLVGLQLRCLRNLRSYSMDSLNALLYVRSTFGQMQYATRNRLHSTRHHSQMSVGKRVSQHQRIRSTPELPEAPPSTSNVMKMTQMAHTSLNTMSNSWYAGRQVTLETVVPELNSSTLNLGRGFGSPEPISSVLFSSTQLPLLEFHPMSSTVDQTLQQELETSKYECPQHGLIEVPVEQIITTTSPIAGVGVEDVKDNNIIPGTSETGTMRIQSMGNMESIRLNRSSSKLIRSSSKMTHDNSKTSLDNYFNLRAASQSMSAVGIEEDLGRSIPLDRSTTPCATTPQSNETSSTPIWLTAYQGEQLAVAINLVSCIIAVGTWSPYILATLAHGLCQPIRISTPSMPTIPNVMQSFPSAIATATGLGLPKTTKLIHRCAIHVTADRIADFRWWAYASSGLLLPLLLFFLDLGLRDGCWKALNYSEKSDRPSHEGREAKMYPIYSMTQVQSYKCSNFKPTTSDRSIPAESLANSSDGNGSVPLWKKQSVTIASIS